MSKDSPDQWNELVEVVERTYNISKNAKITGESMNFIAAAGGAGVIPLLQRKQV